MELVLITWINLFKIDRLIDKDGILMTKYSFQNNDLDIAIEDDFESWEYEKSLMDSKNYKELIRYIKLCLKKYPTNEHLMWQLGNAYILNEEYEKALNSLSLMYKKSFGNLEVEYSILDALFALDRDENDFEWIKKPIIIKLFEVADLCYEQLKRKIKPVSISELYCDLLIKAYVPFNELELYNELKMDERFEIVEDHIKYTAKVKVVKKKQGKNNKN